MSVKNGPAVRSDMGGKTEEVGDSVNRSPSRIGRGTVGGLAHASIFKGCSLRGDGDDVDHTRMPPS